MLGTARRERTQEREQPGGPGVLQVQEHLLRASWKCKRCACGKAASGGPTTEASARILAGSERGLSLPARRGGTAARTTVARLLLICSWSREGRDGGPPRCAVAGTLSARPGAGRGRDGHCVQRVRHAAGRDARHQGPGAWVGEEACPP